MRNSNEETKGWNRKQQRTDREMKREILTVLKNEGEMKRTPLGDRCLLNFIKTRDITDELVNDGLITGKPHHFYSITEKGINRLEVDAFSEDELIEIVKIAKEIHEHVNDEGDEDGNCVFCHEWPLHDKDCLWNRLNEIFKRGEKK